MFKILSIDYGKVRSGFAITDELQLIANPLQTILTVDIFKFLDSLFASESIEKVIIGYPLDLRGRYTDASSLVEKFIAKFKQKFPNIEIIKQDERFTSKIAQRTLIEANYKKKQRQNKANLDIISATIILQSYLG